MKVGVQSMICDPVLIEIVRSNLLCSVSNSDLRFAQPGLLFLALVVFDVVEQGLQFNHCDLLVLLLTSLLLAFDGEASRQMFNSHTCLSLVDVLATRSRGPREIHFQLFRIDFALELTSDWKDGNRYCRGMDAARGFCFWNL